MDKARPEELAIGLNAFEALKSAAETAGLDYLVIGGYAVLSRATYRTTLDLDLMVLEGDRDRWRELVEGLGYIWGFQTTSFVQYAAPTTGGVPLDLMLMDPDVFQKLKENAENLELGETSLPVPRSLDIIAMKLHSLRSPHRLTESSDLQDVIALIRHENLELSDSELRAIIEKYATDDIRSRIEREFEI